jgi:2-aminoethylphosphonate-pyruvate transaminase
LFTPGPLTTSRTVKQAMLRDLGSRDREFIRIVKDVRTRLVRLAGVDIDAYTAVPVQGSGTFGLEAVLSSTVPPRGRLLAAVNGSYGRRLAQIARVLGIEVETLEYEENRPVVPYDIAERLRRDSSITHVSACHCETTSGIMNPIREMGQAIQKEGRTFYLDAMSTFGAVPVKMDDCGIDYLVSSANKCIEGVPGFSFVLARLDKLLKTDGWARSVSLNLLDQYQGLEKNGQFRFTPPTHALLAFHQALLELEEEGGVEARAARYRENRRTLSAGMRAMGFREYLAPEDQGYIITSFRYPDHPRFSFEEFYQQLSEKNFVIYPGKVGDADCFRMGSIGRIFPSDIEDLLAAVGAVLARMNVNLSQDNEES